jgi:hypothetical protein
MKKLFGGYDPLEDIFGKKKGPSLTEKIDMLFTDVETEGKKQGYERASKEYKLMFRKIEKAYKETKELIESQKDKYGEQSDMLIDKLSALEDERDRLQKQVDNKAKQVSKTFDIPIGEVRSSLAAGSLLMPSSGLGLLDIIYSYKEKKLKKAEQKGYSEAKELYEEKIEKLKADLNKLKSKGSKEVKKMINLISDILDEIIENQMQIAELKILLKENQ